MTIDKSIKILRGVRNHPMTDWGKNVLSPALDTAIDTMRKYQKIEQIISDYEGYKWERIEVSDIRRILDGNDD